ncbi:DUF3883 domain-containing protein [Ciceribacter sp. RN22]|uniref:DUF3883 domain-containing protein n=1 Tax=Ciceribacter sp. RN22 TaxID=2954932 RepID=UPI0020931B63|nr:DUF3883 domain-containing protein [Ciceribacter sp. RN22]MCO6178032.1 DUF3883 domain-containing protein [Ciceribacter sp. RN22]
MAGRREVPTSAASDIKSAKASQQVRKARVKPSPDIVLDEPNYVPPDYGASRRTRIGSSVIEQFVAGHDAGDVLRELVQNEYDGGGEKLTLTFGSKSLEVVGSGRNIERSGWERLSVIVGTGNVMGTRGAEVVAPKENGIGSKNFGLRSLFRFGDEIHIRSAGQVALLDLQTQETGRAPDPQSREVKGVRLYVPYRTRSSETLEAFTVEREAHALDLMATSMPDTLLKLAHSGKKSGLHEVNVRSIRTGRVLRWRQEASPDRCRTSGVSMISRRGRMSDGDARVISFQEEEFSRTVELPAEYADRRFPSYYRAAGGRVKIAVSVPIARRKIDIGHNGHFYYPLKAPASRTGCPVSVSAPFDLNQDRSGLNDLQWNDWLIDQAVELVMDLLVSDWFVRYGADAFTTLAGVGAATPDRFATMLAERLREDACWPTRATGDRRLQKAKEIVLPSDDLYAGFLGDACYLDPALGADENLRKFAEKCGAKPFTVASLVRLRCAGENEKSLKTTIEGAANYHFTNYGKSTRELDMQKRQASALSAFPRRLSKQMRFDLGNTASTLSATGDLRPAVELMIVDPDLWADCPEPEANRLHPDLVPFKPISGHCRVFDEEQWLIDASKRAADAAPDDRERETLYRKLLARETPISRAALSALRSNPVIKNQRGDWVAPVEMVNLKKKLARFLDPAIDGPSAELLAAPNLIARLRIRENLSGADLVRFAGFVEDRPETAVPFEKLLTENLKLLSAAIVEELREIAWLKTRSGRLAAPETLHLDTATNRLCIGNDDLIVASTNELLHHKLKLKTAPDSDTLLEIIEAHRDRTEPLPRPDLVYPALVAAIGRERRAKAEFADQSVCWVQDDYHAPSDILVGPRIPALLAEAIPVYRHADDVGHAYQALGAPGSPTDEHWTRFFEFVDIEWDIEGPIDQRRRRVLLEAYNLRGLLGLPAGLENVSCLLDDRSRLFTLAQLRAGQLVEPDFAALEQELRATDSKIGIIERSERSRVFFTALGIRPLSAIAGTGQPELGLPGRPHLWYKPKHSERVLAMLHRPLFARALYEVAFRNRHGHAGFVPASRNEIAGRLATITEIAFFQSIGRRYSVGGASVLIPAQVAVSEQRIEFVAPKTKGSFQLLLAEALAEIAGATSVGTMRSLANAFLPLVIAGTLEELTDYLDRMGIPRGREWELEDDGDGDFDKEDGDDDAEEIALRQVFDNLDTDWYRSDSEPPRVEPAPPPPPNPPPPPTRPPASPPFKLPDIDEVDLTVAPAKGSRIEPQQSSGGGGSSGTWLPPTLAEVERAGLLGRRGEELIYRMELKKVREFGYDEPERYVIWTSCDEPGADHDIRSIDAEGRPRWLEVKATTGTDGRFDWSRKEFEKAFRERDRYELWRVYRVADQAPIAKCFPNPARMLGARQILLELGSLRAKIEDID